MNKDLTIGVLITVLVLSISYLGILFISPNQINRPQDLVIVKSDKKIPPFFKAVFDHGGFDKAQFQIPDPIMIVRPKPMLPEIMGMGPHDILGFRNNFVPNSAEIIAIGDSQTYGVNASLNDSWPKKLESYLGGMKSYNMAFGGWGAPQYLELLRYASVFNPKVVIVAIYTGNDSLESFKAAYGSKYWRDFQLDSSLTLDSYPKTKFPPSPEDKWRATLKTGSIVEFTPNIRLLANNTSPPASRVGYEIINKVIHEMNHLAKSQRYKLYLTIIPTKELLHNILLSENKITPSDEFRKLINSEEKNIDRLVSEIASAKNLIYLDIISSLQKDIASGSLLYPSDENGHFNSAGYDRIASILKALIIPSLHK